MARPIPQSYLNESQQSPIGKQVDTSRNIEGTAKKFDRSRLEASNLPFGNLSVRDIVQN
jgi:hypothetical protein